MALKIVKSSSVILTNKIAEQALELARSKIEERIRQSPDRNALFVLMAYSAEAYVPGATLPLIAMRTYGEQDPNQWTPQRRFDHVALTKMLKGLECQSAGTGMAVHNDTPWQYHVGDTKWPGWITDHGLTIAPSGMLYAKDHASAEDIMGHCWDLCSAKHNADLADDGCWYGADGLLTTQVPVAIQRAFLEEA